MIHQKFEPYLKMILVLYLVFGTPWHAYGEIEKEASHKLIFDWVEKFNSKRFQFLRKDINSNDTLGRTPVWMTEMGLSFFGRDIVAEDRFVGNKNCNKENLQMIFRQSKNQKDIIQDFSKWMDLCQNYYETGVTDLSDSSKGALNLRFDFENHPLVSQMLIHFPNGMKLKAQVGLHGDMKKRPWMIIRGGIFSNSSEFLAERYMFMQIFEQGPFNVMLIENMSGPDFIENNTEFSFGGFYEAQQNLLIAKWLQDKKEPLSQLVHSVHLMGISLGGHGVLMAHQWNKENKYPLSSFMAFCPVVNLKGTSESLSQKGFSSGMFDFWVSKRLHGLEKYYPQLSGLQWKSFYKGKALYLESALNLMAEKFQWSLLDSSLVIPSEWNSKMNFWEASEVLPYWKSNDKPLLLFGTVSDKLVRFSTNGELLKNQFENVGVYQFKHGQHCSFPANYDWNFFSTLEHEFLRQSGGMEKFYELETKEFIIPDNSLKQLQTKMKEWNVKDNELIVQYTLEQISSEEIYLKIYVSPEKYMSEIEFKNDKKTPLVGVQVLEVKLPVTNMDFESKLTFSNFENEKQKKATKQLFKRWIGYNFDFRFSGNKIILKKPKLN